MDVDAWKEKAKQVPRAELHGQDQRSLQGAAARDRARRRRSRAGRRPAPGAHGRRRTVRSPGEVRRTRVEGTRTRRRRRPAEAASRTSRSAEGTRSQGSRARPIGRRHSGRICWPPTSASPRATTESASPRFSTKLARCAACAWCRTSFNCCAATITTKFSSARPARASSTTSSRRLPKRPPRPPRPPDAATDAATHDS